MTITVKDGYYNNGPFWVHLESAVGALSGTGTGRLTRISRADNGANYRAAGRYEMEYCPEVGDMIHVTLMLE